jgi:hypothetical protein
MRSEWVRLCAETSRFLLSTTAQREFVSMRKRHAALAEFASPAKIVEHQHCRDPTPAEHNRVAHALITEYQRAPGRGRDLAGATLLLSMEPALSRVLVPMMNFINGSFDADGDVVVAFFNQVAKWNLEKIDFIAVKLQADTRDAVKASRRRLFSDRDRVREVSAYADTVAEAFDDPDRGDSADTPVPDPFESTKQGSAADFWRAQRSVGTQDRYEQDDAEITRLRGALMRATGISHDEALLLALKGPCRMSWRDIGERLGLKPETARKRHQMLLKRLPSREIVQADLPDFEFGTRSIPVRGKASPEQKRRKR